MEDGDRICVVGIEYGDAVEKSATKNGGEKFEQNFSCVLSSGSRAVQLEASRKVRATAAWEKVDRHVSSL